MTAHLTFGTPVVRVALAGRVTPHEVMATIGELLRHPQWRPGLPVLWDFRQIDGLDASVEELRVVAEFEDGLMDLIGAGRTALAVASPDYADVAELYTRFLRNEARSYRAFRHGEEAEAWLVEEPTET